MKKVIGIALGLLLVWGAAEAVGWWRGRLSEYERRAQTAEAFARVTQAWSDSVGLRADSIEAENVELASRTAQRDTVVRVRYRDVLVREELLPAPDTCIPFIAVRDSIIREGLAIIDSTRAAYDREVVVSGLLRLSRDTLRTLSDSLYAVIRDRPGPRPWWVPSLGVGPVVGWCLDGPCAGVGASLAWRVR